MTLAATMYGAGSIGASNQDPANDVAYCVPVTVTADGLAVAVEIGVIGLTFLPVAYLLADNAGAPGRVLSVFAGNRSWATAPSTTARFLAAPTLYWIAAGNYWIGAGSVGGTGAGQLRYTAGSSGDGYTVDGAATVLSEPGSTGTTSTATDRQYSLRLVVLTEATPVITSATDPIAEGDLVTITGTDLDQVETVYLGDAGAGTYAVQIILSQTATEITFTADFDDGVNPPVVAPTAGYAGIDWNAGSGWAETPVNFIIVPNTGTIAAVQASNVAHLVGTSGTPVVPGGSRMGGTGAVRKPPR